MPETAELALEAYARGVEGTGVVVCPWRSALCTDVVVIVAEVAGAVVVPAADGVDEAGWIEAFDGFGQGEFGVVGGYLAPAFVVDHLWGEWCQLDVMIDREAGSD